MGGKEKISATETVSEDKSDQRLQERSNIPVKGFQQGNKHF